jgi:neutral ceramidase
MVLKYQSILPALIFAVCAVTPSAALAADGSFRASVVKVDITPSANKWLAGYPARQSNGVHDHIFHRIVALDDGQTQFFFVQSDLCLFAPSVYDEATAKLKKETGIDPVQVWWLVTHTHSAPEVGPPGLIKVMMPERYNHDWDREYTDFVEKALVDGIQQARSKLEPARLAVGTGFSTANINRRARDVNGNISLGLNPDGPTDRQIGLIRLERPDGSPIALLANYAMHGTALGPHNKLISGDAPGIVETYVEQKLGAPMLYINGAAGNMAPIYTVQEDFAAAHITEFNVLLGDKILAANRAMATATSKVSLRASEKRVATPRRKGFGWDDSLGNYLDTSSGQAGTIRFPVRFLIINEDIALWSAPVEMFCEISMGLRDRSPYPHTFYFGYTNGWLGYLPTGQAFSEGGYETFTNPFTAQVEEDLIHTVDAYLQGHGR